MPAFDPVLIFRKAEPSDLDFVVECIIEAEKGGIGPIPWCALFNLTQNQFRDKLLNILEEEIEGQEWCLSQFYIAEYNGVPAAGISAWIETEANPSAFLMSNLVYHYFTEEQRLDAGSKLYHLSLIRLPRSIGALQLESIYTRETFRGKGIIRKLIQHIISEFKNNIRQLHTIEIILSGDNLAAQNAYLNAGFTATEWAQYPRVYSEIQAVFPGTSKVKMSLTI